MQVSLGTVHRTRNLIQGKIRCAQMTGDVSPNSLTQYFTESLRGLLRAHLQQIYSEELRNCGRQVRRHRLIQLAKLLIDIVDQIVYNVPEAGCSGEASQTEISKIKEGIIDRRSRKNESDQFTMLADINRVWHIHVTEHPGTRLQQDLFPHLLIKGSPSNLKNGFDQATGALVAWFR